MYELGFYIPEESILHSHRQGNLKSYILRSNLLLDVLSNILPKT
jgi:hypothetical protein